MTTLYQLLGVCPDAGDEALKTAYRRLAKMHHPDLNPNDPDAACRFRQITAAIAILSDAERRAAYDQRLVRELQRGLDREGAVSKAAGLHRRHQRSRGALDWHCRNDRAGIGWSSFIDISRRQHEDV